MSFPKIRFIISPFFLVRHYLKRDIRKITSSYDFGGSILDVGCGEKPYRNLFKDAERYEGIDFQIYSKNKELGSGAPDHFFAEDYRKNLTLPFQDGQFDQTVSFQVLEHHPDPRKMISEMVRVTKSGGYLLVSAPLIGGLHEKPNDFQRLTEYAFRNIFQENGCEILEIKRQGSLFSALATLLSEHLNTFAAQGKGRYFLAVLLYPFFLLFQYSSFGLDRLVKSDSIFINYLILARKK